MVSKLLALGVCLVAAVLAYEEARVVAPLDLVKRIGTSSLENRPALFGVPPYGLSITGPLVTPAPENLDGCLEHDRNLAQFNDTTGRGIILFLKRGTCTFVTKVRNAQNVGAKAVLIVNNEDGTHPLPFMADDGSGGSLATPSLIITLADGNTINGFLSSGSVVVVSLSWGIPHPQNIVEWSFWTSSKDPNSDSFKEDFRTIIDDLGNSSVFTPRYYFLRGEDFGCTGAGQVCGNQCTNGGRYCAVDPEHDTNKGISGEDVVRENLRQICVFKYADSLVPKNNTLWWDYVNLFDTECAQWVESDPVRSLKFNEACSKSVLLQLNVPPAVQAYVDNCVRTSGGYDATSGDNSFIKADIDARIDQGVYVLPSIIINNAPYRGSLYCPQPVDVTNCGVLSAICAGFEDKEPQACLQSNGCPIGEKRDACGNCGGDGSFDACGNCLSQNHPDRRSDPKDCDEVFVSSQKGVSAGTVFLIVFVFVSVVAIGFFYLHRRSQASMRRELADIMQQYVPLGAEDAEHHGGPRVPSALDSSS